jgi:hypothetical protein
MPNRQPVVRPGGPCSHWRRLLARSAAGAIVGVLSGLAVPASAQPVDAALLARTLSPDREQKLLAGARKEGEVSVYTSLTSERCQLVVASDACTPPDADNHEQFMTRIFPRMSRVRTVAQVLGMLRAAAG